MNKLALYLILIAGVLPIAATAGNLVLSSNGKSSYVIVRPDAGGVLDVIAVRELATYLGKATGASFRQVDAKQAEKYSKRIIVGNGALAKRVFGAKLLGSLKRQESIAVTRGNDLLLAGQGSHGTCQAVYRFLKNQLGCRWFTPYGDELVPKHKKLIVPQLSDRFTPSFSYRNHMVDYAYGHPAKGLYLFRNGLNASAPGFTSTIYPELAKNGNLKDFEMPGPACHTLFHYIAPAYGYDIMGWPWNTVEYFFESHPEYFSMDSQGKRVMTMQLCFSNPDMRKQLTARLLENIGREGGTGYYNLSAMDCGGSLCYCQGCKALEAKYKTPGGPLFDYLFEACAAIKIKYPKAGLATLAYRKVQTEKPPVITAKFHDNLAIVFAPIDDDFRKCFDTPENAETYNNLKNWCRLSDKVIVWYYPMLYNMGLPSGMLDRVITDTRLMKQAGVMGTTFEHDAPGVFYDANFADLYTYVLDHIYSDVNADVPALIKEFTNYYYGSAAPLARAYLDDLQRCRKALQDKIPFDAGEGMLSNLTPVWLKAQQQQFDRMESLCASNTRTLANVQMLRFSLDLACLGSKYQAIAAISSKDFASADTIYQRARVSLERSLLLRFPVGQEKARAAQLQSVLPTLEERAKIAQIPVKQGTIQVYASKGASIPDADAALGWARIWKTKPPYTIGLFDNTTQKGLLEIKLTAADVKSSGYSLYLLGTSKLSSDCYLYLGDLIDSKCVEAYDRNNPNQDFDIYISLKCEGPTYGSILSEDRVLCDKIVLVRK